MKRKGRDLWARRRSLPVRREAGMSQARSQACLSFPIRENRAAREPNHQFGRYTDKCQMSGDKQLRRTEPNRIVS
jgi:hypothetical protein